MARFAEAVFRHRLAEGGHKLALEIGQLDAILRSFWPGDAWHNRRQVQLQFRRIPYLAFLGHPEQALRLVVVLIKLAMLLTAACRSQILHAFAVNRKESHSRPILRSHVGDGCPVHDRQRGSPWSVELDELADHLRLPQHLSHRQSQVRRGYALAQSAGHIYSDDI